MLKDELMEATGLGEEELKKRLMETAPVDEVEKAAGLLTSNACKIDSWAYISACHGRDPPCTLRDRMLKSLNN